jgi:hypothetical protein
MNMTKRARRSHSSRPADRNIALLCRSYPKERPRIEALGLGTSRERPVTNWQKSSDRLSCLARKSARARRFSFLLPCLLLLAFHASLVTTRAPATTPNPIRVTLGRSVVALNGPWKFHTGDDPRWAAPNFDDSNWETVDLTPPPGAHDFDVGLTGYVPGWQAKGHRGSSGYAWYRIRISVDVPPDETLALCGPLYVDNAYQVFVNGQLLGGSGDFSGRTPVVHNIHLPRLYPLPQSLVSPGSEGSIVVAFRAWMDAWSPQCASPLYS